MIPGMVDDVMIYYDDGLILTGRREESREIISGTLRFFLGVLLTNFWETSSIYILYILYDIYK